MRLLDVAPEGAHIASGACYVCGSTQRVDPNGRIAEGWLDLEKIIEFEGFLMLCETCGKEAGRLCGLVDPDELKRAESTIADLIAENEELVDRLAEREKLESLLSESLDEVRGEKVDA